MYNMERTEKIQKLCLKMNVSEKEADDALRACGDDILDAALYLEALGRVRTPSGGFYTEIPGPERTVKSENNRHASESFGEAVKRFGRWFVGVLKKGMNNYMEVRKNGETSFRVPLTIFVIALFCRRLSPWHGYSQSGRSNDCCSCNAPGRHIADQAWQKVWSG